MNRVEVKAAMAVITDELIETDEGAHWLRVRQEFESRHGSDLEDLYADVAQDWLGRLAKDAVADQTRKNNAQLTLTGFPDIDATITCRDGEGGYRVKATRLGSIAEMLEDKQIMAENRDRAIDADRRAGIRNDVLIPIMQSEGFVTAGEAIDFLAMQP